MVPVALLKRSHVNVVVRENTVGTRGQGPEWSYSTLGKAQEYYGRCSYRVLLYRARWPSQRRTTLLVVVVKSSGTLSGPLYMRTLFLVVVCCSHAPNLGRMGVLSTREKGNVGFW